jgi:CRP/FNR family transcriptional regulator
MVCRGSVSEYLGQLALFRDLSQEQLARVARAARPGEFEDGQWLFRQGEEAGDVYVIAEGQIALLRHSLSGKESIVALVGADEVLGEEMLYQDNATRDVSARSIGDCVVVAIDRQVFANVVEESSALSRWLLQTVHRRQKMLIDHIERLSVQDAGGRVLDYLLSHVGEQAGSQRLELPIAKRDLAAHLAIQPETLSRVFARMKGRGLLREDGAVMVLDVDELRAHRSCTTCERNCWGCPRSDDSLVVDSAGAPDSLPLLSQRFSLRLSRPS